MSMRGRSESHLRGRGRSPRGGRGYTLVEMAVTVAVVSVLAAVVVAPAASVEARAGVSAAAQQFVLILRRAQADAQAGATRAKVWVAADGCWRLEELRAGGWQTAASGSFGAARCETNYPGGAIEFSARGWPCAAGSPVPRAGSFAFSWGGAEKRVVVQLTGGVRCE